MDVVEVGAFCFLAGGAFGAWLQWRLDKPVLNAEHDQTMRPHSDSTADEWCPGCNQEIAAPSDKKVR